MNTLSLSTRSPASASPLAQALPYLALAGSILSFCIGTTFAKQLFPVIGAQGTAAYRVGISALILLLVFRPWRQSLSRANLLASLRYGAVLGLMNLCFYMALRTIPLGLAIAIEFIGPLSLSLIHARRPVHFLAVALAAGGLALLLPIHLGAQTLDPAGVGYGLCAGLFWALYIVFGKQTKGMPGGQAVALGMLAAALIVVPIGLHAEGLRLFSPSLIVVGLVAALLSSSIPYSLEIMALKAIPARRFGVLISVEPAAGALAGGILLGEHLSAQQWLAVTLVVAASVASVLSDEGKA